jgi:ABC-type ATPase involved in cell division
MRGADRRVGRGQIDADADDLRQLPDRRGAIRWAIGCDPRAEPREIMALRREVLGYVSQFLRVVPRVPTLDVVAEPLLAVGRRRDGGAARRAGLLDRLNIPERSGACRPPPFRAASSSA